MSYDSWKTRDKSLETIPQCEDCGTTKDVHELEDSRPRDWAPEFLCNNCAEERWVRSQEGDGRAEIAHRMSRLK